MIPLFLWLEEGSSITVCSLPFHAARPGEVQTPCAPSCSPLLTGVSQQGSRRRSLSGLKTSRHLLCSFPGPDMQAREGASLLRFWTARPGLARMAQVTQAKTYLHTEQTLAALRPGSQLRTSYSTKSELTSLSRKGWDSRHFWLCGPYNPVTTT